MHTTETRADAHEALRTREQAAAEQAVRKEHAALSQALDHKAGSLVHLVDQDIERAWRRREELGALVESFDNRDHPSPTKREPWAERSRALEAEVNALRQTVDDLAVVAMRDHKRLAQLDFITGLEDFAQILGGTVSDAMKVDRFVWAGPWESNKQYAVGHVVRFDASIWRCAVETETKPGDANPMWQLVLPGRTKP